MLQTAYSWNQYPVGGLTLPEAPARWTAPDAKVRTGMVYVPGGAPTGHAVAIWASRVGDQVGPPLRPDQVSGRGQLAAAFVLAVLAVAVTVLGRLVHRVLNRRRMAAWDADWLAYGPRWTRRQGRMRVTEVLWCW